MKMKAISLALPLCLLLLVSCSALENLNNDPSGGLTGQQHVKLAELYEVSGEYQEAIREYKYALEEGAKEAPIYFALGNIDIKRGMMKSAEFNFLSAIHISPRMEYYNNLAWLYLDAGDTEKAAIAIKGALDLSPKIRYVYFDTLGAVLLSTLSITDNDETFTMILENKPHYDREARLETLEHLLTLYILDGDIEMEDMIRDTINSIHWSP